MKLLPNSRQAHAVAYHVLNVGTQSSELPDGVSVGHYVRALRRLEKAGVLRRWRWEVDGVPYAPQSRPAGWLYLPGPRWYEYVAAAEKAGIEFDPLEEL